MAKVPFPEVPVGETSVFRTFTVPGLFVYRHIQADGLLHFPDFSGGDMTVQQRREALDRAVTLHRPLAALVLFLNIVALEDFIRDLGASLCDIQGLDRYFPQLPSLNIMVKEFDPQKPHSRLDKEPVPFLDFIQVNRLYLECLGIEPIPDVELPRLFDLAIVRHTVAHHGALFRHFDVPRFQYYAVSPGHLINPPVEFVKDTAMYIYRIGRGFEQSLQDRVFSTVIPSFKPAWPANPPQLLIDLIELFNYLGKLVSSSGPTPPIRSLEEYEAFARAESERIRGELTQLCIQDLAAQYSSPMSAA